MQYQAPVVEHHERIDEEHLVSAAYEIGETWEEAKTRKVPVGDLADEEGPGAGI
jgi:hypothetical protein